MILNLLFQIARPLYCFVNRTRGLGRRGKRWDIAKWRDGRCRNKRMLFEVAENVLRIKGNKASFCKAGSDVVGRHGSLERVVETGEEILLGNMGLVASHEILNI